MYQRVSMTIIQEYKMQNYLVYLIYRVKTLLCRHVVYLYELFIDSKYIVGVVLWVNLSQIE